MKQLNIRLPEPLLAKLTKHQEENGFTTVTGLVVYIITQYLLKH